MLRPWFAPRLNFTGIALPAFTELRTGRLSTGWNRPEIVNPPLPKFQWLACEVRTVSSAALPRMTLEPTQGSGDAPATDVSQSATRLSFLNTLTVVASTPPAAS